MADYNASREPETSDKVTKNKDWSAVLKKARKDHDRAWEKERDNIIKAKDDLEFLAGEELSQWPAAERKRRADRGRPILQMNELPQFIRQVTGDMRQMKPALKFVPVDDGGDEKVADYFGGLTRYIENRSVAQAIYNRAADSQVACGIGHWRVTTEYADDSTFNQEIRIAPVDDGVAVLWDPDSILPSREDAKFCIVPVDMSRSAFEEEYPGVSPASFDDEKWEHNTTWCTDDYVRVAEYWVRKPSKRTLALTPQGGILDLTDEDDPEEAAKLAKANGARIEKRDSYKLCRYLITAMAVLEENDWPGRLIPIVPLIGEEVRIGRKVIRKGIVRNAMDPQRMVNYFHSQHTEVIALQPKAPFLVTELNVAKYQTIWDSANDENLPYLPYEPDSKNGGAAPQRMPPPVSSQGVIEGLQLAKDSMRGVIGIYDPSLGNKSNETSGKAIEARQREGDTGTVLYLDNFVIAIQRTGQILADLIPHIYDTERTIRIMGEDGKIDKIEINKAQGIGDDSKVLNDVTAGAYDVVATVGPSYMTKRQEAKEGMIAFVQAAPETGPVILDLVAKAQDWPNADGIARRLRATLPPQILAMEEAEKQGMDPDQALKQAQAQQQPPPDPQMMKVQADAQNNQQRLQFEQQSGAERLQFEQAQATSQEQQAEQDRQAQIAIKHAELQEQGRQADAKLAAEVMLERERIASAERIAEFKERCLAEHNMHQAQVERDTSDRQFATDQQNRSEDRKAAVEDRNAKADTDLTKTAMPAIVAKHDESSKRLEDVLSNLTKIIEKAVQEFNAPTELEVMRGGPGQPTKVIKRKSNGAHAQG